MVERCNGYFPFPRTVPVPDKTSNAITTTNGNATIHAPWYRVCRPRTTPRSVGRTSKGRNTTSRRATAGSRSRSAWADANSSFSKVKLGRVLVTRRNSKRFIDDG